MFRQILTYIPANVIPAVLSFGMIYIYTRLLSVDAYGDYSLAFTAVLVVQTVIFMPLHSTALRLFPAAERDGEVPSFLRTLYQCVGVIAIVASILGALALALSTKWQGPLSLPMLLAMPLLVLRGAVLIGQGMNRMQDRHAWYVGIECLHAILGLLAGLAFLALIDASGPYGGTAAMAGLITASALCAALSLMLQLPATRGGRFDRELGVELFRFGAPLAMVLLTTMLLQYADRFAIAAFSGASAVGIYAVAFALVERPTTLLSMSVATATYPLAVRALERSGPDAARLQAGRNGVALIAITVPACVGLALSANHVVAVLIGPDYRPGAAVLIQILAFRALARAVSVHVAEQAFYFVRQPRALIGIYGPAAAANIVANIAVIPHFGVTGAAWVSLVIQVAVLCQAWVRGRRLFPLWLPWRELACVGVAAGVMAVVLRSVQFPKTPLGLALMIGTGALAYGAALLALQGRNVLRKARHSVAVAAPPLQAGNP